MSKQLTTLLVCMLLAVMPMAANSADWRYDGVSRVVAIADVHGAFDAMVETLGNAGILDESRSWSGGDAHLLILGDLLDRGPDSRAAMDLLMRLEGEAEAAGGKVHVLIGNHEAMNLVGDLRYVSRAEYAAFADEETAAQRDRWFKAWASRNAAGESDPAVLRATFDQRFPPGFFAHRQAFSSTGKYGKWLLAKPIIVVVNGTAFVHGGLSPLVADIGLEGVNGKLVGEMRDYVRHAERLFESGHLLPTDNFYNHPQILAGFMPSPSTSEEILAAVEAVVRLNDSSIHSSTGPLWYRGNVACSRVLEADKLARSLDAIGADRVVIGHTPTPGRRVLTRLDGKVIQVDTGMLNSYYKGRGHALLIEGEQVAVVSQDSAERMTPMDRPRRVGARPDDDMTAAELEALLRSGEVIDVETDRHGRRIVSVSGGGQTVQALFAEREGRNFYADVAAYRIDRLLELDMVPVTVVRSVGGSDGSLQFLPDNWLDEEQRAQTGRGGSAQCPLDEQWTAIYAFDTLIYNEGRTLQRMLYSPDIWQLVLVGHDRAFSTRKGRPAHLVPVDIRIGTGWRNALESLTEENVAAALDGVLDKRRQRALLKRRDELLELPP
ncbi:MAG: metallophosphoesterase [Woeseiaceae bacterium]|nr:metallophosphoesterase [Woeseiaceae bacterium]